MFRSVILPFLTCLTIYLVTQLLLGALLDSGGAVVYIVLIVGFSCYCIVIYKFVVKGNWGELGRRHFWVPLVANITFFVSLLFVLQVLSLAGIPHLFPIGWAVGLCVWFFGNLWCERRYGWDEAYK